MRFKYRSHSQNIYDSETGMIYSGGNSLCDLLNSLNDENEQLKHSIKEAYETERTSLGKSVLKQLIEGLE